MIRELRDEDVPGVLAIIHEVEPHWVMNEAAFRHGVATRPARLRYLRLVAEEDGEVVAWGAANLFAYAETPDSGFAVAMVPVSACTPEDAMLHADPARGIAQNAGTGTLRGFRRRGLALLAKVRQVQWAAESGITSITTDNDETNAMLAINERLGYRPLAEVRSFVRELR